MAHAKVEPVTAVKVESTAADIHDSDSDALDAHSRAALKAMQGKRKTADAAKSMKRPAAAMVKNAKVEISKKDIMTSMPEADEHGHRPPVRYNGGDIHLSEAKMLEGPGECNIQIL